MSREKSIIYEFIVGKLAHIISLFSNFMFASKHIKTAMAVIFAKKTDESGLQKRLRDKMRIIIRNNRNYGHALYYSYIHICRFQRRYDISGDAE
jgi:hypothetical protein